MFDVSILRMPGAPIVERRRAREDDPVVRRVLDELRLPDVWMTGHGRPRRNCLILPTCRDARDAHGMALTSHRPISTALDRLLSVIVEEERAAITGMQRAVDVTVWSIVEKALSSGDEMVPIDLIEDACRDLRLAARLTVIRGAPGLAAHGHQLAALERRIEARLEVWRRGYGCLGVVDGFPIVYRSA